MTAMQRTLKGERSYRAIACIRLGLIVGVVFGVAMQTAPLWHGIDTTTTAALTGPSMLRQQPGATP